MSDQNNKNVSEQAQEQAQAAAEKIKNKAQEARRGAEKQAEAEATKRKSQVVTQVRGVAQALHKAGEQLREENQDDLAGYTEQIASRVEQVSDYLDEQGVRGIARDVESFARKQPALFLGGAVALGVVGARFLKSSRPSDDAYGSNNRGQY